MGDALLSSVGNSVGNSEAVHTPLAHTQMVNKRIRLMERMVKETSSRPTV
jgi:hypothetical protein